jgi:hypothetical protein
MVAGRLPRSARRRAMCDTWKGRRPANGRPFSVVLKVNAFARDYFADPVSNAEPASYSHKRRSRCLTLGRRAAFVSRQALYV